MSNATIIARILESVAAYECGQGKSSSITASVELHEPALENISSVVRQRIHVLSVQVLEQDVTKYEESLLGISASRQAVHELKTLLKSLE